MQIKQGTYGSSNGLDTIGYTVYETDGEPKGILQIGHGMSEHIGRYEKIAAYFTDQGFVVCGNDHLGHGESVSSPEDFGYFGKEKGWVHLVDDMHLLTKKMMGAYPGLPYFLLGHSMGSLLSRAYISCYGEQLSGTILMGTSGRNGKAALLAPLLHTIIATRGPRYRSKQLYNLAFGKYTKKYTGETDKLGWMTRDRDILDRFRKDPKCNFIFTAAGFRDLTDVLRFVSRKEWASLVPRNLPILLVSGGMDPVGEFGNGVRSVHRALHDAGIKDLHIILYEDSRHELFNEPEKDRVLGDIREWMDRHTGY